MDNNKKNSSRKNTLYSKTLKLLITGKKHFFFYQVMYGLLVFMSFMPLEHFLAQLSKEAAGYSYITKENMADFLTKPITLLSIAVLFLFIGVVLLIEISLILSFLMVGKKLEEKPSILIFLGSFQKAFCCFKGKKFPAQNFPVVFLAYCFTIISSAGVIYVTCTQGRIPKYLIKSVKHADLARIILIGGICLLLFVFLKNLFTLPYFLLENKALRESRKSTRQLSQGHRIYTILCILGWNIGILLVSAAVYLLVIAIAACFVVLFVDSKTSVAVFLTLYEHINVYTAFGLIWFGLYCNLGLISELFLRFKRINDEEFRNESARVTSRVFTDKRKRMIAICLVVMIFLLDGTYTYISIKKGNRSFLSGMSQITITAHRGSSSDAPENTLPAIEAAINNTADVAEIDVQETKDGEVIVLHDSNLERTGGLNEFIWNLTFEEVRKLDMGSWFSKDFEGTQIPTLEEVLRLAKGRIKLNIEIKSSSHFKDLEDKVVALIEEYDFENQCVIQSTDYNSLVRVKEINSDIKTGYILMAAYGDFKEKKEIDFFSIRSSFVNRNMVESAHKNGKEVYAWTVNKKNEIRRMKVLKVDNIITDRPILARELIYKDNFDSSFSSLFKLLKQ